MLWKCKTRAALNGVVCQARQRESVRESERESESICSFSVHILESTKHWVGRSPNNCAIIEVGSISLLSLSLSLFLPVQPTPLSFINLTCKVQARWPVRPTGLHLAQPVFDWTSASLGDPWTIQAKPRRSVEFELSFRSRRVAQLFCYSPRLCLLCWKSPICFSLMWGFLY